MKISRRFTKKGQNPFSTVNYEWRTSTIRNEDGSSASQSIKVEVPKQWSQLATDILAQKYLRRCDVPLTNDDGSPMTGENGEVKTGMECSVKQVATRLAGCWQSWGDKYKYFDTKEDSQVFFDEMVYMLIHQMGAPNSPQWFNTGLAYLYGIKGSKQGHWYADPETGELKEGEDAFTHPQPHACFIQSVKDDLLGDGGIYSLLTREGRIFKFGSGTGTNFSNIRSEGERLGSGGVSSGLMSFLRIYDRAAGSIKSGGTTRRAAKMVCLDIDHPEVESFITWKSREEQKVAALVTGTRNLRKTMTEIMKETVKEKDINKPSANLVRIIQTALESGVPDTMIQRAVQLGTQGVTQCNISEISTDFNDDGYATVSGQNSNNSVRVPHSFLTSVQKDGDWALTSRTEGKTVKTLKARKLWKDIAQAAWECADPGLQFDDTINDWHTCPVDGRIRGSNPCSEYMFLDDTACNLASLNLAHFISETGEFKIEDFKYASRLWTIVLEISVTMAQFPSKSIALKSYQYRTLGLGYANLGSVIMKMGLAYDSAAAAAFTGAITAIMTGVSYATSAEMAKDLGPFDRYPENKNQMLRVIRNHRRAAYSSNVGEYEDLRVLPVAINAGDCTETLLKAARAAWDQALDWGEKYGYRNAQVSVLAPTGTIGLVMDCDTTGIEPDFALIKSKKLAGGGYFKIVNNSVAPALKKLGYTPQQIRDIEYYCKGHGTLEGAPNINSQTLQEKGLNQEIILKASKALGSAFDMSQAFSSYIIGENFLKTGLGLTEDVTLDPGFNLLSHLGFSQEEIDKANLYCCGTQTMEGAPHLLSEHYSVFDCANQCGARGTRTIPPHGHLRIMAAAQSFISGAISKTINLPSAATVADVEAIHKSAWELGIKAVAIYRDASKLSQPLTSSNNLPEALRLAKALPAFSSHPENKPVKKELIQQWPLDNRRKLPFRRGGFVQEGTVGGHKIFVRTGEYPDGSLGEIFIDMYKEGASYRGVLNCFAVLASKALQYGVPLKELVDSFTFTRFEPSGPVTGHEHIKNSTSILDFVFRTLGHHYLNIQEFLHIKPSIEDVPENNQPAKTPEVRVPVVELTAAVTGAEKAYQQSRRAGYTGDSCSSCGSLRVRQNGTCTVCDDCGATSGCS